MGCIQRHWAIGRWSIVRSWSAAITSNRPSLTLYFSIMEVRIVALVSSWTDFCKKFLRWHGLLADVLTVTDGRSGSIFLSAGLRRPC